MFVVRSLPQLEEAVRVGAREILVHGQLALSLYQQHSTPVLDGGEQCARLEVEAVEYETVDKQFDLQSPYLLLCRSRQYEM